MQNTDNITCKVVLVGDTGVGKTCIIQRYVNDKYSENVESTITSTYTYKNLECKKYKKSISFDIWDTAGQELYRALAKNFYLNATIGILVYDIRRRESFNSIKDYWYEQLKESGEENIIIGIAGNKFDLFNDEKIPEDKAKNFAKEAGGIFRYTSAKESVGIQELFVLLGLKYLDPNFVDDGKFLPQTNLAGINNENNNNGKNRNRGESIKLNKEKIKEKKKKFC